jgi:hypothetical protein
MATDNRSGGRKLVKFYEQFRVVNFSYDLNNGAGNKQDPTPGFVRVSGEILSMAVL